MSILVEAITVIFRNSTAEALIQGGVDTIQKNPPNSTFRTDGNLSAIGFMNPSDIEIFVNSLKELGFKFIKNGHAVDIAVCDQNRGFTTDCEWLGTDLDERGIRYCWLLGEKPGEIVTQAGWNYENSMYTKGSFEEEGASMDHLEFIRDEGGMGVYWDKNKNKEVYITSTFKDPDDMHTKRLKRLLFYSASKMAYDSMIADGWMSIMTNSEIEAFPHFIMRFRNQISFVFLNVTWNGEILSDWHDKVRLDLIKLAEESRAIPVLVSMEIRGNSTTPLKTFDDVTRSNEIEIVLQHNYVTHDLLLDRAWSEIDYDLEEDVELSDWEVHDFGIQIVRQSLEEEGHKIREWNSQLDDLIQIVADIDDELTYILVKSVRYPETETEFDKEDLQHAVTLAARNQAVLKVASVSFANSEDSFDPEGRNVMPLFRGKAVMPRFTGLVSPEIEMDG
jgi:hypothetical protein